MHDILRDVNESAANVLSEEENERNHKRHNYFVAEKGSEVYETVKSETGLPLKGLTYRLEGDEYEAVIEVNEDRSLKIYGMGAQLTENFDEENIPNMMLKEHNAAAEPERLTKE